MRQEGSFTVRAPRERVWSFFIDPVQLQTCISDPHKLTIVDEDTFEGEIKTGIGFMKGTFTGSAKIVEKDPPKHARVKGHGGGMGSAFDVDSVVELSESGGTTTVRWVADVVMSGKIATMGARLLQGTIDKKASEFFENARRKLEVS